MDWYGTLQPDGMLTDVGYRIPRDSADVRLEAQPPHPRQGVRLRWDPAMKIAVPVRLTPDDSDTVFMNALAIINSTQWAKLSKEDKARYQAVIDARAATAFNYVAPGVSSEPLIHDHDIPPPGANQGLRTIG